MLIPPFPTWKLQNGVKALMYFYFILIPYGIRSFYQTRYVHLQFNTLKCQDHNQAVMLTLTPVSIQLYVLKPSEHFNGSQNKEFFNSPKSCSILFQIQ